MANKICIVSPDIVGPIANGGIGTHCFYLSSVLVSAGFDVTVLFTGPLQNMSHQHWKDYYKKRHIDYEYLKSSGEILHCDPFHKTSYDIFSYLKDKNFDFIHFQDWLANGLVTIQAKETTHLFDNSVITVTLHSPTQWQQEGMMVYSSNPVHDLALKWAEEYCAEHCDIVISPSQHMFRWVENAGWKPNQNRKILPCCYSHSVNTPHKEAPDLSHLIFFGRLETRKGLEYFIDSIKKLNTKIRKISFLGKIGNTSDGPADKFISENLGNIEYKILSNLDTFEAAEYIKNEKGLVVIPSLLDNLPFTVIEMIENKVPFICSNAGGIPEMADEKVVFDINDKNGLVNLLNKLDVDYFKDIQHKYNSENSNQSWVEFHSERVVNENTNYGETPLISICVPYYNYPDYLPLLLGSIKEIDYPNYEVIIVNDGSPQEKANTVFEEMKSKYPEFSFYSKANSGVGDTRNYAASKAKGEFLVFMDSDNLAVPNMLKDFLTAINKSNADFVTCYFDAFDEKIKSISPQKVLYRYFPLGSCLELGMIKNVFGDANFIVKRKVFEQVQGFGTDRATSWEDWELLAKLNLEDFKQKVVPISLFWYRHTEAGFSRNTSMYKNHQRILNCYAKYYPAEINRLLRGYVAPMYYSKGGNINFLINIINRILPVNSKRREFVKKLAKRILR